MKKKELLKMNLQHFAEPAPTPAPNPTPDPEPTPVPNPDPGDGGNGNEPQPSLEEQLQQMRVENAKLKKAQEDAAKDASSWKKKYNATLSDAEKLAQEKADKEAEKDAELNRLRRESAVSKFEKNFLTLGYSQELAKKAAEAQFDGDTDTLFLVQSQAQEAIVKAKEAEWYKNRPEITTGTGNGSKDDPFLKGFNS